MSSLWRRTGERKTTKQRASAIIKPGTLDCVEETEGTSIRIVEVPRCVIGMLKNGDKPKLREVEERFAVRVSIRDTSERHVTSTARDYATRRALAQAPVRLMIVGHDDESVSAASGQLAYITSFMRIPAERAGWVLGKNLSVLKNAETLSGARVLIFFRGDENKSSEEALAAEKSRNAPDEGPKRLVLQLKGFEDNVAIAEAIINAHEMYAEVYEEMKRIEGDLVRQMAEFECRLDAVPGVPTERKYDISPPLPFR